MLTTLEAAEKLKEASKILTNLQCSQDTFEEDWNNLWNKYEKAKEEIDDLRDLLLSMKQKYSQAFIKSCIRKIDT